MMTRTSVPLAFAALVALSCGGAQPTDVEEPGRSRAGEGGVADDLDVDRSAPDTTTEAEPEPEPASPVTFVLKNTHPSEGLFFNMDRGYGGFTSTFSGKPPRATVVHAFPRHCTASCDAEDLCPTCPEPDQKNQKLHEVAPGQAMEIPWDGMVHVYEKVKGKGARKGCECHRMEEIPPEAYTVRICGLRLSRSARQSSKLQCIEGQLSFPADGPQRVELEFGTYK